MTLTASRQWTRAEYMDGACTHQQYYSSLVRSMGAGAVERCVLMVVHLATRRDSTIVPVDYLRVQLAADEHLNNIPLRHWDNLHDAMIGIVAATATTSGIKAQLSPANMPAGQFPWSLSDSVCCLKACAVMMVEQANEG